MSKIREILLNVIELYKHMPCLWDKTHKDYRNKENRLEAQLVLLEIYKDYDRSATVTTLTKKIQNLRTSYTKELRKVKESLKTETPYVPTLWYYDALNFLEDVVDSEPYYEEFLEPETWSSSDTDSEHSVSQSPNSPPKKRLKVTDDEADQTEDVPETYEQYETLEEEWEILGKSIGIQLRDLENKQLTIAQKMISDTIYYAKLGLLTERSCVALHQSNEPNTTNYPYHFVAFENTCESSQSVSSSTPENPDLNSLQKMPGLAKDPLVKTVVQHTQIVVDLEDERE